MVSFSEVIQRFFVSLLYIACYDDSSCRFNEENSYRSELFFVGRIGIARGFDGILLNVSVGLKSAKQININVLQLIVSGKERSKTMNKLHVALKLLQLLNERKSINSRIVADEFNVSLRTAQRYLLELSGMPCVIVSEEGQDNHYGLAPDYKLKGPLLKADESEHVLHNVSRSHQGGLQLNDTICLMCGKSRGKLFAPPYTRGRDNRQYINLLVSIVRKQLANGKCGFP